MRRTANPWQLRVGRELSSINRCSAKKPAATTEVDRKKGSPAGVQPPVERNAGKRAKAVSNTGAQPGRRLTKRQVERLEDEPPQRLAKVIAQAGLSSRRRAEELIVSGAVKVNGKPVVLPQHLVVAGADKVVVNGAPLPRPPRKVYFAVNKPKGYLCAGRTGAGDGTSQEKQRLVVELCSAWLDSARSPEERRRDGQHMRLFTVGRLDVQTTGLIFVTNDGEWAQRVQHPSAGLSKEYVVTLTGLPTTKQLQGIASGCVVDGVFVQPKLVAYAAPDRRDKLRVVVGEGRNREVRVLVESAGLAVKALKRVRVGGYRMPSDLSIGQVRQLRINAVRQVVDKSVEKNPHVNPAGTQ